MATQKARDVRPDEVMQEAYLVKVYAGENNNKFYWMRLLADGAIWVNHGRVGTNGMRFEYPSGCKTWDEVYRTRMSHGYLDQTDLRKVLTNGEFEREPDDEIHKLLHGLHQCSRQFADSAYTVEVGVVTQEMVAEAQRLLNEFRRMATEGRSRWTLNSQLEALWSVIPRAMKNVRDELLKEGDDPLDKAQAEQVILDNLGTQVATVPTAHQTLSEVLGITVAWVDLDQVKRDLGQLRDVGRWPRIYDWENHYAARVSRVLSIQHATSHSNFRQYLQGLIAARRSTGVFVHGSSTENWLNIFYRGLAIHGAADAHTTAASFGNGIYFADRLMKSLGYSDLVGAYWTGGQDVQGYVGAFEVHTGRRMTVHSKERFTISSLGPYDCVFYDASGGGSYYNNELVVYRPQQCSIRYLLEVVK